MWTKHDIEELIAKLEDAKASVEGVRADQGTDHEGERPEGVEDRLDEVTDELVNTADTPQKSE